MRSLRQESLSPIFAGAVAAALILTAIGCRRYVEAPAPVASLASTPAAARDFEAVRVAWEEDDKIDNAALVALLVRFLEQYPADGRAPLVRGLFAIARMDQGNYDEASNILTRLAPPPSGTLRDLVVVAEARLDRHEGHPDRALERLRPLVGKLVDPIVSEIFLEEVTRDALAAKRDYEAVAYMDAWLRGSNEERLERTRRKVTGELAKMDDAVLLASYRGMLAGGATGYGSVIRELVATRVAQTAIAKGDVQLARWLLDANARAGLPGATEAALGELATSARGLTRIVGRTIGLLLPTSSSDLREQAADVARGVAWALDLPRADPSTGDGARLVTRDAAGDATRMDAALEELSGEGASVIIAGLDVASANRALAWAASHAMPVLLLTPPELPPQSGGTNKMPPQSGGTNKMPPQSGGTNMGATDAHAFVVGEPRAREYAALLGALSARGVSKVAVVGGDDHAPTSAHEVELVAPVSCRSEASSAGESLLPIDAWRRSGVRGVLVDGGSTCARDVVHDVSAGLNAIVALTLEASSGASRASAATLLSANAGVIPVLDAEADVANADVRAYMARYGTAPGWWTALGRDAGALARIALRDLPAESADNASAVAERREAVLGKLAAADTPLWTSETRGFDKNRVILRSLRVLQLPHAH